MTTGVWEILKGERIVDSDAERSRPTWASLGLTQRGRPPRDNTARQRRHLLAIVLGWALAGAGVLRVLHLIGGL